MASWTDAFLASATVAVGLLLAWSGVALRRRGPATPAAHALVVLLVGSGLGHVLASVASRAWLAPVEPRVVPVIDVTVSAAGSLLLGHLWCARTGRHLPNLSLFAVAVGASLLAALLAFRPDLYGPGGAFRAFAATPIIVYGALGLVFLHGYTESVAGPHRHAGLALGTAFSFTAVHWSMVDVIVVAGMDGSVVGLGPTADHYARLLALLPVGILFFVLLRNMRHHEVDHVQEGCRGAVFVLLVPAVAVVLVADLLAFGVIGEGAASEALARGLVAVWAAPLALSVLMLLRHARPSLGAVLGPAAAAAHHSIGSPFRARAVDAAP